VRAVLALYLPIIGVHTVMASTNMSCTVEMKALATLEFSLCQEQLMEDNPSDGPRTSCEFLKKLIGVCGAHYKVCHPEQERREIMRMWIKQFVRETIKGFSLKFDDIAGDWNNGQDIKIGQCDTELGEFFDQHETEEITSSIGSHTWRSNITQDFGKLVDESGGKLDEHHGTLPSQWGYCSWQLTKDLTKYSSTTDSLFSILPNLFHCDGKCNTNNGDDQEWISDDTTGMYYVVKEDGTKGEIKHEAWGEEDLVEEILGCYWHAGFHLEGVDFTDLDKAKMGLCKPFKTLIQNCSIPMSKCLGSTPIIEVAMAEFLKNTLRNNKRIMQIVISKLEDPDYFGDFIFNDCKIFGGIVAKATTSSSNWIIISFSILVVRNIAAFL